MITWEECLAIPWEVGANWPVFQGFWHFGGFARPKTCPPGGHNWAISAIYCNIPHPQMQGTPPVFFPGFFRPKTAEIVVFYYKSKQKAPYIVIAPCVDFWVEKWYHLSMHSTRHAKGKGNLRLTRQPSCPHNYIDRRGIMCYTVPYIVYFSTFLCFHHKRNR